MDEVVVACENLVKIYKVADLEVLALQGLDLQVFSGEMMALVGTSGSGKSTLLNILGGLDIPNAGRCMVAEHDLLHMTDTQRLGYRRSTVGHIWQQSGRNLLNEYSLQTNVELPQIANGIAPGSRSRRARTLLGLVGLGEMAQKRPSQLSGGEQQRAGIAVALANAPRVLLADEPTGELDSATAEQVLGLLRTLNQALGLTIVLVTHDPTVAAAMDRTIAIRDGRTSTETVRRDNPLDFNVGAEHMASAVVGLSAVTHRESIIIDKAGRLQIPSVYMGALPFNGRAEMRRVGDHLEIWPLSQEEKRP